MNIKIINSYKIDTKNSPTDFFAESPNTGS